ncbi:hypothetical protein [Candidatus Enterococcus courvalinii]|uniref:Uncharacterized protein n=1 Tax=Candidatus Enterococcus courvalinii TaxID=2815329 RepID=A0ABS3I047_9ENTE|nr:hypothetical protein [Enterococcus sp. MSG2901]MBO0481453.1 hypothetical protein [Enterococcus sp. MSG2901]
MLLLLLITVLLIIVSSYILSSEAFIDAKTIVRNPRKIMSFTKAFFLAAFALFFGLI